MRPDRIAIIGLGIMGRFIAREAAQCGLQVMGFDAGTRHNTDSASAGPRRLIRIASPAIGEGVCFATTSSAQYSASVWISLGLLSPVGHITVGSSASTERLMDTADSHGICSRVLSREQVRVRAPWLRVGAGERGYFEPNSGVIDAQRALRLLESNASRRGAVFQYQTAVHAIEPTHVGFRVLHARGSTVCDHVVIAAGSGSTPLGLSPLATRYLPALEVRGSFAPNAPVFVTGSGACLVYGSQGPAQLMLGSASVKTRDSSRDRKRQLAALFRSRIKLPPTMLASGKLRLIPDAFADGPAIEAVAVGQGVAVRAAGFSGEGFKFAPSVARTVIDQLRNPNQVLRKAS